MAYLTPEQQTLVSNAVVRIAMLVHFDFLDDPKYYWMGARPLQTNDGRIWEGTAGLASVSGLDSPIGVVAQQVSFALSAVDPTIFVLAKNQSDQVKGRACDIYLQLFDENFQTVGDQFHVWSGTLDLMTFATEGDGTFRVELTAESIWSGRRKPPFAYYTDADQQSRHPGDRGLELMAGLPGKTINWPL